MYFTDVVVFSVLRSFSSRGIFPNGTFFFCLKDMFITFLRMWALWWLLFQLLHVGKVFLFLWVCSLDKEFEALSLCVCVCVCPQCVLLRFSLYNQFWEIWVWSAFALLLDLCIFNFNQNFKLFSHYFLKHIFCILSDFQNNNYMYIRLV